MLTDSVEHFAPARAVVGKAVVGNAVEQVAVYRWKGLTAYEQKA